MDQPEKMVRRVYTDGSVYEGQWGETRIGRGTYVCADGSKYVGEWIIDKGSGKASGKGVYTDKKGGIYTGTFAEGKPHGDGIYIYHNGTKFEGSWKNGVREGRKGFGVSIYANGDQKVGMDGKPEKSSESEETPLLNVRKWNRNRSVLSRLVGW